MKLFLAVGLVCCYANAADHLANPQLANVHSVYILSMTNGMDQYLANRLTSMGVFQVVADPQKADAVLTDRLGQGFEDKIKDLYPPPPAPLPPAKKAEEKDKDKDDKAGSAPTPRTFNVSPVESSWSRGRGNIFLVDRQTRSVIWSLYERPKNSTPDELSKTAAKMVDRLKRDLAPPKAQQ